MLRILMAFLFVATFASAQDTIMYGSGDVIGNRFVLKTVNGEKVDSPFPMFIEWRSSVEVSGRICNAFRGKCVFLNNLVKAENIISTRMACPNPELAALENKVLAYLRNGMSFIVFGNTLEMRRDDIVLEFEKVGTAGEEPPAASVVEPAKEEKPAAGDEAPAAEVKSEAAPAAGVAKSALIGRKFVLASIDGESFVAEGRQPFIQFGDEFSINGSACNNFMGQGVLENGVLRIPVAAASMMLCEDPKLSEYEMAFHTMMREGAAIELSGTDLVLKHDGKTYLFAEEESGK